MEELFNHFYQTSGVCTDTRSISKDSLFIALKGENFDGNQFAKDALSKGAKYAIVSDAKVAEGENNIFYVEDTLIFLQRLAEYHRKQFNIPIIGITGTNGKTTSKELIAAVLQKEYKVLYTKGNFNNHIGVPLTLLGLTKEHEIAIIEMGASKIGDIKELTDIAHPNYGIITNIGKAHIEGFGSVENIIKTKTELYQAISETDGKIIYNDDDDILKKHLPSNCEAFNYGTSGKALINGKVVNLNPFLNFQWQEDEGNMYSISTKIIGKYNFYNMLAAITFGVQFGVTAQQINEALHEYIPDNNRSQIKETTKNTLILDAYNANPTSVVAALENFANIETEQNKLFILGDMLELGKDYLTFHKEIILKTSNLKLQGIFVGKIYQEIAAVNKDILAFSNTEEARSFLITAQPQNNLILLKGSRGIGLEKLVESL